MKDLKNTGTKLLKQIITIINNVIESGTTTTTLLTHILVNKRLKIIDLVS